MPQSEGGTKKFKIGELFKIETPLRKFNANTVKFGGKYPYVVRTSTNNGIRGYITENKKYLNPANTISFGQDTATIFFQDKPYFTGDKIKILTYKHAELNTKLAIYLITAMRKAFSLFSWGVSSFDVNVLKEVEIFLPIDKFGNINHKYIEERVRELEEERVRELEAYLKVAGLTDCSLTLAEREVLNNLNSGGVIRKAYKITNFFNVSNSHNILKSDIVFNSGTTPYVTACEGNNSIVSYISYNNDMKEQGNSILIGGKTLVITYQPDDFFSNDSHNLVLIGKDKQSQTESIQLYLVASLYKSLKPLYHWGNSISKAKIQNDTFLLPTTSTGEPDYALMDTYISAVKKQIISRVHQFIKQEKQAYINVINHNTPQSYNTETNTTFSIAAETNN